MPTPSGARFVLTQGAHVSPSSEAGFTAVTGTTLSMQLEASPALDVRSCVYEILRPTKDAPSLTLSASGIASPPTSAIAMSMPAGIYSFVLRCTTNTGEAVLTALGKPDLSVNVFERIVSVPNSRGHRKIVAGETLEFTSPRGWTDAYNDLIEEDNFSQLRQRIVSFDYTALQALGPGETSGSFELIPAADWPAGAHVIAVYPSSGTLVRFALTASTITFDIGTDTVSDAFVNGANMSATPPTFHGFAGTRIGPVDHLDLTESLKVFVSSDNNDLKDTSAGHMDLHVIITDPGSF